MHPHQKLFPTLPAGRVRTLEHAAIQIDGMEVEFDETVALLPVRLEVIEEDGAWRVRPSPGTPRKRSGHD